MRKQRWAVKFLFGCFLTAATLGGYRCDGSKESVLGPEEPPPPDTNLITIVKLAGEPAEPPVRRDIDSTEVVDTRPDGEVWLCKTKHYDVAIAPEKFFNFNPNAEVIIPGISLQGKSLKKATPDRLLVKRGGGAIAISALNGPTTSRVELEEVTPTRSLEAMNQIIATTPNIVPGSFDIRVERIEAKEQLSTELGAKLDVLDFFNVGGSLSFSTDRAYNRVFVKLTQRFYSMVFERPASVEEFFHQDVTGAELQGHIGPGNPPVYISSVTYGRVFFLLFESTTEMNTMKNEIDGSFFGIFGGDRSENDITQLANLSVKAWSLGGKGDDLIQAAMSSDISDLRNFLASSVDIRTGEPLSYVVRTVGLDKIVKNGVATQYSVDNCTLISAPVPDPFMWFIADKSNLDIEHQTVWGETVMTWRDLSEAGNHATLEYKSGDYFHTPSYQDDIVGGLGAVEFTALRLPFVAAVADYLNLYAGDFRNTDYTIVALLNWNPRANSFLGQILPDSVFAVLNSTEFANGMQIGFKGRNKVFMSHNGSDLSGNLSHDALAGNKLYTFRFSQSEGLSIFVDGQLIATDPGQTTPLSRFNSAVLGLTNASEPVTNSEFETSGYGGKVYIAELVAFDEALNDIQRTAFEDELRHKYRL